MTGLAPIPDKLKSWRHSSASQVKTFRRCNRKWWFEKIAGFRSEESPAMRLGTQVHDLLERYVRDGHEVGTTTRADKIARQGIDAGLIPAPKSEAFVERFVSLKGADVRIIGYVDLIEPWKHYDGSDLVMVTDYKTTSGWQWTRTAEELAHDAQAVIYTRQVFNEAPDMSRVGFRHVYLHTGLKGARDVSVTMTREENTKRFARVVATVAEQRVASSLATPDEVTPNKAACSDFGGCPFANRCNLSGGFNVSTLLERLKAKKAAAEARDNQTATAPAEQPAPYSEPHPQAEAKRQEYIRSLVVAGVPVEELAGLSLVTLAMRASQTAGAAHEVDTNETQPTVARSAVRSDLPERVHPQDPINPPDGTPANVVGDLDKSTRRGMRLPNGSTVKGAKKSEIVAFLANHYGVTVDDVRKLAKAKKPSKWLAPQLTEDAERVLLGEPGQLVAVIDDGPTRDSAETTSEAKTAEPAPQPVEAPTEQPETRPFAPANPVADKMLSRILEALDCDINEALEVIADLKATKPAGTTVYVDCAPNGIHSLLTDIARPLVERVEDEEGVAFYGSIPYNAGEAMIATELARDLASGDITLPRALVVDTSIGYAGACLEVLTRYADSVVSGGR